MEENKGLVTIQKVLEIIPIEGALNVELAKVKDYYVLVSKGQFDPEDENKNKGIFFEIGSFLPYDDDRYDFLRKRCRREMDGKEGLLIKTTKLCGVYSQGLLMPFDKFPEEIAKMPVGTDLTGMLRVKKFEAPVRAQLAGDIKGKFPELFLKKTGQDRVQRIWSEYKEKYPDMEFEVSVKLDGTSTTIFLKGDDFGVCSKNYELKEKEGNTYWKMARKYKMEETLRAMRAEGKYKNVDIALQGETIGHGINGNNEKIKGQDIYIFDVYNISELRYMYPAERMEFLEEFNKVCPVEEKLKSVPIEETNKKIFRDFEKGLDIVEGYAKGKSLYSEKREGLVFKSVSGERVTFKGIDTEYASKQKND